MLAYIHAFRVRKTYVQVYHFNFNAVCLDQIITVKVHISVSNVPCGLVCACSISGSVYSSVSFACYKQSAMGVGLNSELIIGLRRRFRGVVAASVLSSS